jgi:hypothetical protein
MVRAGELFGIACVAAVSLSACGSDGAGSNDDPAHVRRQDAVVRAKVFLTGFRPEVLAARPNAAGPVDCRFLFTDVSGTTPKFDCELTDGQRVKVKYGRTPEISGEIAATRLLRALGFGADEVRLASRVRCYGCPVSPFYSRLLAKGTHLDALLRRTTNYAEFRDYEWTAVEEKLEGAPIEAGGEEGWAFFELNQIDPARGGAAPHEVDALRLMAVFLVHWDNKPRNQRLVCLSPVGPDERCRRPLVMLQDVGATFGPRKVNLSAWRDTAIWMDPEGCRVSMKSLPHDGATFGEVTISERGRRLLADRLVKLSPEHVRTLFLEANFPGDVEEWESAFRRKVKEIAGRTCESQDRVSPHRSSGW